MAADGFHHLCPNAFIVVSLGIAFVKSIKNKVRHSHGFGKEIIEWRLSKEACCAAPQGDD